MNNLKNNANQLWVGCSIISNCSSIIKEKLNVSMLMVLIFKIYLCKNSNLYTKNHIGIKFNNLLTFDFKLKESYKIVLGVLTRFPLYLYLGKGNKGCCSNR